MSKFHLGWFLGPGITIQGWNEPGFAPDHDAEVRPGDADAVPDPGDQAYRPRPDAHHDLLSALAAGALAVDARSLLERPHRLEHRDRDQRRRGAELRPRQADRPRPALRHG